MANLLYAVIDFGANALELVIYEISDKKIKKLDHVKHIFQLGKSAYLDNEIGFDDVEEICTTLYGFTKIMKTYGVTEYKAFTTSAIREAKNAIRVLDRIKVRTGLDVEVLSNSEERFISYKAVAAKEERFNKIIEKSTALVDVGAGSVQLSLFDNGSLVTTQNVKLGALRISEVLSTLSQNVTNYLDILSEHIDIDLTLLDELFIKGKKINNIIFTGEFIPYYVKCKDVFSDDQYASREEFMQFYDRVYIHKPESLGMSMDIPYEVAKLILPSVMVYKRMLDITKADVIWMPGTTVSDGLAIEYAEKKKKITLKRDFGDDILAAAKNISKRYSLNKAHIKQVENVALSVFDEIKKYHGLGEREKLLLRIACILHDCGQYLNFVNPGECSYNIVMSTEIIGLSHKEREIIASVVKYNTLEFDEDDKMWSFDRDSYLIVAKLAAILRISNAVDRGHKQKFKNYKVMVNNGKLIIHVDTFEDITIEKAYYEQKGRFFEEMYGLKPVIKQKR